MKLIHILVEGQTEETFVGDVFGPYLEPKGLHPNPILATTERVQGGSNFRGGLGSYGKVKYTLQRLLWDSSAAGVTTFFDYYGLPGDFPGYHEQPRSSCYKRVAYLEERFREDIKHPKFVPYLALHEFEAMLFVSPQAIDQNFPEAKALDALQKIKAEFDSPEEINLDRPPSKRLLELFKSYQKTFHSPLIVEEIGLNSIRQECSHFANWLNRLESFAEA